MKYQKLGKTDLEASVVSFGGWGIGGGSVWSDKSVNVADLEKLLDLAAELGINYIDTAPVYGTGASEQLLGEALKKGRTPNSFCRQSVLLTGATTAEISTMKGTAIRSITIPAPAPSERMWRIL